MRTVYAPLDVRITSSNDKIKGALIRTIYPNYFLLSIKTAGMALLTAFYIRQLLYPNPTIPDLKMDWSKPIQGIFLPLFVLSICLYFLGREVFFITRKIRLYYYAMEIHSVFYKKNYPYDQIKAIAKTFEEERIRSPQNSASFFYVKKYYYEIFLSNGKKIRFAKRDFFNLEKWMENLKQNKVKETAN
ncbi:hypothetical protein [Flavobacterium foetidum]|uniref:hypothetical protein n=1 Tax=Flavobacterium foetidum TaxID=2026681 RepID=UPI00107507E4|nr:hypothetical protein [Flavobacterium foetidum]KAF2509101.1 hypothetical protein E0W73_19015 [Flavobacterium foetidum]